ncbi:hypothetical protein B0T25DRAFT_245387 [Lasiosphaeria hispida]|uniref:Zn(2)-C6 fungal-type domain-containing protein n=1 Tax=Lasiosphaeria hispida TaxID=260671 RepID=A0AAJ0MCI3_9PEZI|nr:hypothetical protein B0T25DRAFT_245387 [Lasiosphaeria hispida]
MESPERHNNAADNNLQRRQRAYRTRTRTGCITCRVRRVRCDEQKPFCNRCVSTGRNCDGYADDHAGLSGDLQNIVGSAPARSQVQRQDLITIPRHPGVPLPRNNAREVRSYHFFLDVAAPAIASVFDVDFWLTDIPRTCHLDPAIWHAVVSLGSIYENYITNRSTVHEHEGPAVVFAIQQFNAAIKHLVHLSSPRTVQEEKWRALTVSIVFTHVFSIQGLYSQSNIHLTAAKNLMEEFEGSRAARQPGSETAQPDTGSVSYQPLRSIVANLENHSQAFRNGDVNVAPDFLGEADAYTAWRYYTAPVRVGSSTWSLCQHGKCVPSRATPANLARAGRAFESLLNALMTLSQQNSSEVTRLLLGAEAENSLVTTLIHRQQPYARAFHELDAALTMFIADTTGDCFCFRPASLSGTQSEPIQPRKKKAVDALRFYHAACYPILFDKPPATSDPLTDGSPPPAMYHPLAFDTPALNPLEGGALHSLDPRAALARHITRTLDIAESILQQHESPNTRTDASGFIPALPITQPLFIMAHISGLTPTLRRRIITLLRQYPRREGLWDSEFAAAVAELIMAHELPLVGKPRESGRQMWVEDRDGGEDERREGTGREELVPELTPNKVYGVAVKFTGAPRSARVVMQSWAERAAGEPGRQVELTW